MLIIEVRRCVSQDICTWAQPAGTSIQCNKDLRPRSNELAGLPTTATTLQLLRKETGTRYPWTDMGIFTQMYPKVNVFEEKCLGPWDVGTETFGKSAGSPLIEMAGGPGVPDSWFEIVSLHITHDR